MGVYRYCMFYFLDSPSSSAFLPLLYWHGIRDGGQMCFIGNIFLSCRLDSQECHLVCRGRLVVDGTKGASRAMMDAGWGA